MACERSAESLAVSMERCTQLVCTGEQMGFRHAFGRGTIPARGRNEVTVTSEPAACWPYVIGNVTTEDFQEKSKSHCLVKSSPPNRRSDFTASGPFAFLDAFPPAFWNRLKYVGCALLIDPHSGKCKKTSRSKRVFAAISTIRTPLGLCVILTMNVLTPLSFSALVLVDCCSNDQTRSPGSFTLHPKAAMDFQRRGRVLATIFNG